MTVNQNTIVSAQKLDQTPGKALVEKRFKKFNLDLTSMACYLFRFPSQNEKGFNFVLYYLLEIILYEHYIHKMNAR